MCIIQVYCNHRDLHSYPTRRSSDLTVNLAARLESATRGFEGVDLVISPAVEALVHVRFVTEPLGAAPAKGFSGMLEMYTVRDRKSTRLNSSHGYISYAVFCLKKKKR